VVNWRDKRVLVTGATGLVGSWLVNELLRRRAAVVALIRDFDPQSELIRSGCIQRCSVVSGRLESYATVERAINEHEPDTVFHLGAQTIVGVANRSPLPTFEANIRGTYNLLEACRRHRELVQRILVASSDKAYGAADELPYDESSPLVGRHPYDVSKSCADLIAQAYHATYDLPIVIARCGNIYGGGDLNWSRLIPGTIRSLRRGDRPIIRSDGTFLRDYVYVKDAVRAYLLMGERAGDPDVSGQAFNFGPGRPASVLEVVDAIRKLMGSALEPDIRGEAKHEIHDQYLDSHRARDLLGWGPQYSLEQGLRETMNWYEGYLQDIEGTSGNSRS